MEESTLKPKIYIKDEDDSFFNFDIDSKAERNLISVENEADFNTDDEKDVPISYLKCFKEEIYNDTSFNTDSDLMKKNTSNKEDNDCRKNSKAEKNLIAVENEADFNTDDEDDVPIEYLKSQINLTHLKSDKAGDDNFFNTKHDENCEMGSDNGNSSDYEPEPKRRHLMVPELDERKKVPDLDVKKKSFGKGYNFIYGKFVIRQCPMCKLEFDSIYDWKQHLNIKHNLEKPEHLQFKYNNRGAKCKLCDFQTATPNFNKLLDHETTHMPNSYYLKCKLCNWKTKTRHSIHLHLRQHHAEALHAATKSQEIVCQFCHEKFETRSHLDCHIIKEHGKLIDSRTLFLCLECDQEFTSNFDLRTHVFEKFLNHTTKELCFEEGPREGGKSSYLKCTQCPQTFVSIGRKQQQINISEHYMLHLGETSGKLAYKCKYCHEGFRRYDNIPFHVCDKLLNLEQSGVETKQDLSKEPVVNKNVYMKHIRHVCLKCGMSFGKIGLCKKHMFGKHDMNTSEGLDFKSIGSQDGTEIYECIVCEEFTCDFDLNTMLVHARSHSIYDPFQCKRCQMTFAYDRDIPGHQCVDEEYVKTLNATRTPTGYSLTHMEFFCPKCGLKYSYLESSTRHMKKAHGMNEPHGLGFEVVKKCDGKNATIYNCTECIDFTIIDKDLKAMLEHARQHLPYKSFRCTLCSEQFKFNDEAKQHQCTVNGTKSDDYEIKIRLNKMGRFCPKCGKKFVKTSDCKTHITKVHGFDRPDKLGFEKIPNTAESSSLSPSSSPSPTKVIYRCMDCLQFTLPHPDVSAMLEHAREHLPFDSFWCRLCDKRYRLRSEAKLHKCDTADGGDMENAVRTKCPKIFEKCIKKFCPECNKEMPSIKAWRRHLAKYHEMNSLEGLQMKQTNANLVECLVCQVHIPYKRRYEHRLLHLPYKPYQCTFCAEYFVEIDKARMHCAECKLIPTETLVEGDEQKEDTTTVKRRVATHTVLKKVDASKETNKESEDITDDENNEAVACEESSHKSKTIKRTGQAAQESDSETPEHKVISVVLTNDNDYAKFVRISCPLCPDTEFETNLALSQHFQEMHNSFLEHFTIHNTNAANCKTCNKYFNVVYKKTMAQHYLGEINAKCYSCRLCDKAFQYVNSKVRLHLIDEHEAIIAGQSRSKAARSSSSITAVIPTKMSAESDVQKEETTTAKRRVARHTEVKKVDASKETNKESEYITDDGNYEAIECESVVHAANESELRIAPVDISKVSRTTMAIHTKKAPVFNKYNAYISYACPECDKRFETSEQWHLHINFEHDFFDEHKLNIEATSDGYKRCTLCNVNISCGALAEQRHKLTHMQYRSFICTICLHRSTTIGVLTQHFRRCHFAKGEFKCFCCKEVLSTSYERNEHIKSVHDPSEYPRTLCRICFNTFRSVTKLRRHMDSHPNRP